MNRLRVAVIGMGVMGRMHAAIYQHMPHVELVATVEADPARAHEASQQFAVPSYSSVEELLSMGSAFEAASICLPDHLHVDAAIRLAQAGVHLLVEKPLATTLEGCDAIIAAAAERRLKLMVGFTLRFEPRYRLVWQAAKEGKLGDIVYQYARRNNILASARRLGGRVSLPFFLQVHDIDAMRWIGGSEVVSAYALSCRRVLTELGVDDAVISLLRFADGSVGCIESNWVMPDSLPYRFDFRHEVVGTVGKADIELADQGVSIHAGDRFHFPDPSFRGVLRPDEPLVLRMELEHFVECILDDRPPLPTGQDGRVATAVALAIERSLKEGTPVPVPG